MEKFWPLKTMIMRIIFDNKNTYPNVATTSTDALHGTTQTSEVVLNLVCSPYKYLLKDGEQMWTRLWDERIGGKNGSGNGRIDGLG